MRLRNPVRWQGFYSCDCSLVKAAYLLAVTVAE